MIFVAIFNGILAAVIVTAIVAPLVWAIATQDRDRRPLATADSSPEVSRHRARAPRQQYEPHPQYKPLAGRA